MRDEAGNSASTGAEIRGGATDQTQVFFDTGISELSALRSRQIKGLDIFPYGNVMFRHGKGEHHFGRIQRGR
jgi:hypothetical protein